MLAEVFVDEFKTMAIIGCNPEERIKKQPLLISFAYQYDIAEAASSDNVEAAIDYDDLCQKIARFIAESRFHLIETLADRLIDFIFDQTIVKKISLFVYKPDAIDAAKRVGIKLQREKQKSISSDKVHELNWE